MNDNAPSLFALESLLRGADREQQYELVTAASGQEALRQVLHHEFAVILLDVDMPGMDGYETASAIHSHPRSAGVPIIFLTAHFADEIHRLKAYQSGAADYLFTPVIPQVLQTKVAVFVELTKKNLELKAKTRELAQLNQDLRVQRLQDLERANRELEQEVAERKLAEQRAHELSIRDALTGLVNRRSLIGQLEHAVASADRQQSEFALLFLDLDTFKQVNDELGHEVGDELLRMVAARLLAAVRASDVVARLGGDEFVVLLEGKSAASNAARVARKIEQAHRLPFEIDGHRLRTSTSIGIAIYPQDGANAQTLMRNADTAMYHAKESRRGSIEFFRDELNARELERARWSSQLQQALAGGELELRWRPKADVDSRVLCGAEAVLHWRHPQHGLLVAAQFLPAIADRELLDRVNEWAIGAACAQSAIWRADPAALPELPVSIDLVVVQIRAGLAERIAAILHKCELGAVWLELEIAEPLLVGGDEVETVLGQLRDLGVRLAVDGFGSAGASLATLRQLRLDTLKIDRAFIADIGSKSGADMIGAIVRLGRALEMCIVAEGVDGQAQLAALKAQGCDQYQGDYFSTTLQAGEMRDLLERTGHEGHVIPEPRRASRVSPSTAKKRGQRR